MITLWQSGEEFEQGRRQARARPAVPGRPGHRQDDALQGHRHQLQLPVRDDARARASRRCSSAWTRSWCVCWSARPAGWRASGAASASSSSTRSTPSACAAQALGRGRRRRRPTAATEPSTTSASSGRNGALTPTGDLILETRAWRERLFAAREAPMAVQYPRHGRPDGQSSATVFPGGMMGGMGGSMALNQLLVHDGRHRRARRCMRKFFTNRLNTFLDAMYIVPQRGRKRVAAPAPRRSRARSRSTSSAPATCRSRCSTRRSSARAAWAATSGSARRPRTTARTSSTSTWPRSTTSPTSTPTSAATSWRGSPTATRRR